MVSEEPSKINSENEDSEESDEDRPKKKKHGWTKYEGMTKKERKQFVKEENR